MNARRTRLLTQMAFRLLTVVLFAWPAVRAGEALSRPTATEPGTVTPLLALPACRAEFTYLREHWRRLDLSGAAVRTDGWTTNIAETEWPFMGVCYLGYAAANLAQADPKHREEYFDELRWLIEALQTRRLSGFLTAHFGAPFGSDTSKPAVFVHGHFLNVALRYREASGDPRFDTEMHRVARLLAHGFARAPDGILPSYSDMWWISDNFPALSALARHDRVFGTQMGRVAARCLRSVQRSYLDPRTGMIATYVNPTRRRCLQGPRGISQMYGLHFLRDFAPEFAARQYALAREHLFTSALGFPGVLEFPSGEPARPDIDSGPLVFGLGPSASGFGIAAAATMGDFAQARRLAQAACAVGLPILRDGRLRYLLMPPVGQTVILYGKTLLLLPRGE